MKTWKVIYQKVPYNYTSPSTLVIEAESREAALVTAYDHLTRRGHSISVDSVAYDLNAIAPHFEPRIDWELVKSLGWPTGPTRGGHAYWQHHRAHAGCYRKGGIRMIRNINATQREAIGYVLDLAFDDQQSYLSVGSPEQDYGDEWPETARFKACMFERIAKFSNGIGLHGEFGRWNRLARQFRASGKEYKNPEVGN